MPNLSSLIKSIRDIMREDRGLSGDGQRIEQLAWMLFLKIMDDKDQEQEMLHDDYVSPVPTEFQWRNWAANSEGITGDELQQFIDQRLFPALRDLPAHDPRSFMVREVFEGNNNYMKSGTNLRKVVNKLNGIGQRIKQTKPKISTFAHIKVGSHDKRSNQIRRNHPIVRHCRKILFRDGCQGA
jgi:type I restriction enzyme M protein